MALVLLFVVVEPPGSDRFEAFVPLWYGLWGAAVVLALLGAGTAAFGSDLRFRARIVAGAVSASTLALTAVLAYGILELVSRVS